MLPKFDWSGHVRAYQQRMIEINKILDDKTLTDKEKLIKISSISNLGLPQIITQ